MTNKELLEKVKDILISRKWKSIVKREESPPFDWITDIRDIIEHEKIVGYKLDISGIIFFNHESLYSYKLEKQAYDFYEKKFLDDRKYFFKLGGKIEKACDEMINRSKKTNNIKKLLKISELNKIYWVTIVLFPDWLKEKFNLNIKKPIKPNFIAKYRIDLAILVKLVKKEGLESITKKKIVRNKKLLQAFNEFVKKYSWMGVFHLKGKELNLDYVIKEIIEIIENKIKLKIEGNIEEKKISGNNMLLSYYIYLRTHMAESQMINTARIRKVLLKKATKLKIPIDALEYMLPDEIKAILDSKVRFDWERIKKRKNGYLLIRTSKDWYGIIDGVEYKNIKKAVWPKIKSWKEMDNKNIKGVVANKGKCRGEVRVLLTESDIYKIKDGDILISSSTTPNFIPAMIKAKAFVTDEGGIASHAAIVAREMKKPCIIGTKIATKILKDGDLVEVDADKGIVKKLK